MKHWDIILATFGPWHWAIIAIAILVLFGGQKIPELARGLARGLRIFRDEMHGIKSDIENPPQVPGPEAKKPLESKPDQKDDAGKT